MVTMGDMNNLLMCFFIVMMGDITVQTQNDFWLTMTSFRGSIGALTGGQSLSPGNLPQMGHNLMALPASKQARALSQALKKAVEAFKPEIESKYVRVQEDERGLVITLSGDVFFDQGSARLKTEMRPVLGKIGRIIKDIKNFVRVEGHTDNAPVNLVRAKYNYKSNWELSSSRSLNVLHYLVEEEGVSPKQISSAAFGEYRPLDDNSVPEGRAFNRRVDIVIVKDRFIEKSTVKDVNRPLPDEEWR